MSTSKVAWKFEPSNHGQQILSPTLISHTDKKAWLDLIEKEHPGCLHQLCRHAQRVLGVLATLGDLAKITNEKSAVVSETCQSFTTDRRQSAKVFKKHHRKEKSPVVKPSLTDQPAQKRQINLGKRTLWKNCLTLLFSLLFQMRKGSALPTAAIGHQKHRRHAWKWMTRPEDMEQMMKKSCMQKRWRSLTLRSFGRCHVHPKQTCWTYEHGCLFSWLCPDHMG